MDSNLISKALCFHGQPLQKIWEGERGPNELSKMGINPDFSVYAVRQKTLTFQDRAKRLKLHQFLARNAQALFDQQYFNNPNFEKPSSKLNDDKLQDENVLVVMPPYESFIKKNFDKSAHLYHALRNIQPGDIIYGQVAKFCPSHCMIRLLCTGEPVIRYLVDITIKAYLLPQNMIPFYDKKGLQKSIANNDYVCCEVLDISIDADRMNLGMKGTLTIDAKAPLGIITADQLPEYYKRSIDNVDSTYNELLITSKIFNNPGSEEILIEELGLKINDVFSNMKSLRQKFPQEEFASELRQIQASKWAFRSVADGIEHFKVGRHSEAFQCLNKALKIDPKNVEGLVARGALYANSGSFKKAVEDFETALKLNPYHANARKYMGETLVALGRSYEEDNNIPDAKKAYEDCLQIIPTHDEAKSSLYALTGKSVIDKNDFMLSGIKHQNELKSKELSKKSHKRDKKKKNKSEKSKRHSSSSSSSSSESNDSSTSSSNASDTASTRSSDSSRKKKKKSKITEKNSKQDRKKSLSPLSKRMADLDEQHPASGTTRYQFNQPFHMLSGTKDCSMIITMPEPVPPPTVAQSFDMDYDAKVKSFLEMTRDDSDYESLSVRKLIEEASKHKKERKNSENLDELSKLTKKKDKKDKKKKVKKEIKKKKKDKKDSIDNMDLKEALKIFKSLPILQDETKLTKDLEKFEKSIEEIKRQTGAISTPSIIPEAPSLSFMNLPGSSLNSTGKLNFKFEERFKPNKSSTFAKSPTPPTPPPPIREPTPEAPKPEIKPFAIRAPVVLDKFGCFRLAEPIEDPNFPKKRDSRSRSRNRSRSRSPYYRRRSPKGRSPIRARRSPRHGNRTRYSRSRSRSPAPRRRFSPYRRSPGFIRRSRSYSRSRSRSPWRRNGRGGRGGAPFRSRYIRGRNTYRGGNRNFRGGRSSYDRYSRSVSRSRTRSPRNKQNSPSNRKSMSPNTRSPSKKEIRKSSDKWMHDKFDSKPDENEVLTEKLDEKIIPDNNLITDEPSIEEIDKIINQAQKERKEQIIQNDKDIVKKHTPTSLPF